MSLLSRLTVPAPGEVKLPVHQFMAALAEFKRGAPGVNLSSISNIFGLSTAERTTLQEFLTQLTGNTLERTRIHDVLLLGEGGQYTLAQTRTRLNILTNQ